MNNNNENNSNNFNCLKKKKIMMTTSLFEAPNMQPEIEIYILHRSLNTNSLLCFERFQVQSFIYWKE